MPEFNIAFARSSHILPFLHFIALTVFIGFQAHFLLVAKFFMKDIEGNILKYQYFIEMFKRLGYAVYASLIILAITGTMLGDSDISKIADPMLNTILATKWFLFGFLVLNVIYSTYRLNKAQKSLRSGEYIELHENLIVIVYYFIPLNIAFALLAVYLGIAYGEL